MVAIEPIRTKRLLIREFLANDREQLLAIVRDPSQIEHMLLSLETEQQLDEFLSMVLSSIDAEQRLQWHFAVADLITGQFLGSCCLMIEPGSTSSAELGYWFLREAWGRGYATESSAAMLALGFRSIGLHRVWGKCHVRNAASAKVMEKLGMVYEGTLREHAWLRDHYRSSRIYGMLESEYVFPTNLNHEREIR
ncbi:MAG TPA: GNAT family protein [Polyangiaceae bacterium]|nr:GNAT family protein [Polyangiaceae bacterium]